MTTMSFKIIVKPVRGQKGNVYLYLYHLISGGTKPQLCSLKINVPKKYCIIDNKQFKRISKELPQSYLTKLGFSDVKTLNSYIDEQLQIYIKNYGDNGFIPRENKTLNKYFDKVIEGTINQGTKLRYKNVKGILEKFQYWNTGHTDIIPFRIIDNNFINLFKKYLIEFSGNSIDTSNYKLKCLKSILNKSHNSGYYTFNQNPFSSFKFQHPEKKIEILDLKDLNKLINTDFREVYRRTIKTKDGIDLRGKEIPGGYDNRKNRRYKVKHSLNDLRNYFLFQLFSQGIRLSDLITLRWNDFILENGKLKLKKVMVKTNEPITILVNDKMTQIISNYLERYVSSVPLISNFFNNYSILNDRIKGYKDRINQFYTIIGIENPYYKELLPLCDEDNYVITNLLISMKVNETLLKKYINNLGKTKRKNPISFPSSKHQIMSWFKERKDKELPQLKDDYKQLINEKHKEISKLILHLSKTEFKGNFVFPLLNDNDFKNISNHSFNIMDEYQYRKFQSVRCYYNKNLKLLGKQCGIEKKLTSHLSRHSYTSLIVELGENINLFDVMSSLGHKHLKTTQTYLKRFSNKKIENLNEVISNKLDNGDLLNI